VAIKEHPAMIGAIDADRLIGLVERHDNLVLLPPSTNNYAVLRRAAAVVSVNSKSGAEAGLLGKPVIVLGDAFYREAPFAVPLDSVSELEASLQAVLSGDRAAASDERVRRWFAALWPLTLPGELYVPEAGNVETFTASLIEAVG
jgi:capsule polysaccharide export protein KpsC/LpsZ